MARARLHTLDMALMEEAACSRRPRAPHLVRPVALHVVDAAVLMACLGLLLGPLG